MLSIDDMVTLAIQTLFKWHIDHPKTLVSRFYSDDGSGAVFITTDPETVKAIESVIPKITHSRPLDSKIELPDLDFTKPTDPPQ